MAIVLPSYFWSEDQNIDRRTSEQDEFNREVSLALDLTESILTQFFGDLSLFQSKDFFVSKTTNPAEDFRFRHGFGVVATDYAILNASNNGGGSSSVDYPVRTSDIDDLPVEDVDDREFITLTFTGRGDYLMRINFDTRIAGELDTIEGPV